MSRRRFPRDHRSPPRAYTRQRGIVLCLVLAASSGCQLLDRPRCQCHAPPAAALHTLSPALPLSVPPPEQWPGGPSAPLHPAPQPAPSASRPLESGDAPAPEPLTRAIPSPPGLDAVLAPPTPGGACPLNIPETNRQTVEIQELRARIEELTSASERQQKELAATRKQLATAETQMQSMAAALTQWRHDVAGLQQRLDVQQHSDVRALDELTLLFEQVLEQHPAASPATSPASESSR